MTTRAMSPLQQRMLEDMQLRGLSARTREAYARAVWQLAQYYHRSPDQLSEEELRQYFLYLTNKKQIARPTATIALCGIKFFYEQTLKQAWPTLRFVRPAREWKLPVVLSREEVRRILALVRLPVYRACLPTIDACGLRLLEGTRLQVPDVDSARMLLHIHGKSKQDRYVPALQKLALDPRYVGGRLGFVAVLHTWTRVMLYHPHVPMLVTGGGLAADGKEWLPARHANYLMPQGPWR
ncbi:MAG: phage integrase N-terminal SAM-like domain-containing protein [Pyrinomonadaceae bacterium]